jgi:murein DD-endopeptidase MepM/ murein hydrolase activator NlpD
MVLRGDIENSEMNRDSLFEQFKIDPSTVDLTPIKEDSLLRASVALEDKYNLFESNRPSGSLVLFSPVTGTLSQEYSAEIKHYAVDVVAPVDTPIKAVANGTVIFAEWTADTGYVIILEHKEGLLSVYKHNGSLNKNQGEIVRAGEVIASVGNTGEFTTGPHLHFELWTDGIPVNPLDYVDFK